LIFRGLFFEHNTGIGQKAIYGWKLQAISKMQITFKDKARADEKAEHTWGVKYVSILKKLATP
jgi:hypothetical protein